MKPLVPTRHPLDSVNQDCDGADRVRFRLSEGFEDLQDWDRSGNLPGSGQVLTNGDVLVMDSHAGGGGALGDSWVRLKSTLVWPRGEPWGVLHLPSLTDATCTLTASALDEVTETFTTAGIHEIDLSGLGLPPFTIDELEIRCSGPGSSVVNFLTLGNAAYVWPPLDDLGSIQTPLAGWVDTNTPVGGATNNVLEVADGTLYAVSDVGSRAWTTDGENWSLLNDLADEFTTPQHLWPTEDLAIWDLAVFEDGTLWALTGDKAAREEVGDGLRPTRGSLFSSPDAGVTWDRVLGAEDGVASYGRNWDCDASSGGQVARSGGELMAVLSYPTAGSFTRQVLLVATDVPEADDPDPVLDQGRGVRLVDEDLDTCMLPLPATAVAPIGALALGEGSVGGESTLLVGLKAATGEPGLVRCSVPDGLGLPLDCDDLSAVSCEAVAGSEGLDVRDLEVDPDDGLRAYVADGGRDRDGTGACTYAEPAVVTWDRSWDGVSWNDTLAVEASPFTTAPGTWTSGTELVGLAVSPWMSSAIYEQGMRFLYAFFPGGQHRSYGVSNQPTAKRTMLDGQWDWEDSETQALDESTNHTHAKKRWPNVLSGLDRSTGWTDRDHWVDDQVGRPRFAPAYAVDGLFHPINLVGFDCTHPAGDDCLVVSDGFGIWPVDHWYADKGADLDAVLEWLHAVPDDYQLTVATDVAVLWQGSGADQAFATARDLGMMKVGEAERGEIDCHFPSWKAQGRAVDVVWGNDLDSSHVWVTMGPDETDGTTNQVVLHSSDGGASFCHAGTGAGPRYVGAAAHCDDPTDWNDGSAGIPDIGWPPCDGSSATILVPGAGLALGTATDIQALDDAPDVAVAAFRTHDDREGLWFTLDGGATWSQAQNFADPGLAEYQLLRGFDTHGCTEEEFFSGDARLAIRPWSDDTQRGSWFNSTTDFRLEVVVAGPYSDQASLRECGIRSVVWTASDGSDAAWENIYLIGQKAPDDLTLDGSASNGNCTGSTRFPQNACELNVGSLVDVRIDPWQADDLIVSGKLTKVNQTFYGGVCRVDLDLPDPVGDCETCSQWRLDSLDCSFTDPCTGTGACELGDTADTGLYPDEWKTWPRPNLYRARDVVVDPVQDPVSFTSALPHPDVENVYFLGTSLDSGAIGACQALEEETSAGNLPPLWGCASPGPRLAEFDPGTGAWTWGHFPTRGLPNGNTTELDWGGGFRLGVPVVLDPLSDACFATLYAATNGSGVYQWVPWWVTECY